MISYEISKNEFNQIASFIYDEVGIHLPEHKINLVRSRLSKRLRTLGFSNFTQYYSYLKKDNNGEELLMLTNEISTNVTSFFREPSQWEYLEKEVLTFEKNTKEKKIRIWSAACSSGQEPYTIVMFLLNTLKTPQEWDIKILATDISEEILLKASKGVYTSDDVKGLPKNMINKYFEQKKAPFLQYHIKPFVKSYITFRKFNLVHSNYSIIKHEMFDWIFCRNVMIYFDVTTKNKVVNTLVEKIKKEGYLLIGHSESLMSMHKSEISLQAPSIYKKAG